MTIWSAEERYLVSKHSDARQYWMIDSNQSKIKMNDHTSAGKNIYTYSTRKFYNLLSRVRASKEIQWYFSIIHCDQSINPCDLSTKTSLHAWIELAHIFRLRLRTSKLLSVILYRLKLLALVDYHLVATISSTFLRKNYPSTRSVG